MKTPIHNWSDDDKPREKLIQQGCQNLSNSELLAILIGSGNREESAVALGQRILASYNHQLAQLSKVTVYDLMRFKGIGEAKAVTIVAALELGRRRRQERAPARLQVLTSEDIFKFIQGHLIDLNHEELWLLHLNRALEIIEAEPISKGGLHATIMDPKIIFKRALEKRSARIALIHNHPSGNLEPSKADIQATQKIIQSGMMLEIPLVDHLIISERGYYSFKDEGLL